MSLIHGQQNNWLATQTQQKSTTKAITDKAKAKANEIGEAVASSGVVEVISQASKDTKSIGDSLLKGLKSGDNENSTEELQPQPQSQPSPSGVTGGRKRRRKSRKSRRKKSRKSRRSRRRKSKRKTRRRRKRRNRK